MRPRRGKTVARSAIFVFIFRVDIKPANIQKMITTTATTTNTPNGAPMMVKDYVEGCCSSTCRQTDHFIEGWAARRRWCRAVFAFLADVAGLSMGGEIEIEDSASSRMWQSVAVHVVLALPPQ